MAEEHFNPFTNERESFFPPAAPGEPTVYRRTLSDGQAAGALTEAEIAEALEDMAEQGYVTSESVYPGFEEQWIATDRKRAFTGEELDKIAAGDDDAPTRPLMRVAIADRLLRAIDRLAATTADYDTASGEALAAMLAEADARKELADCEAALIDEAHKSGELGTNDKQRAAATKVLLSTHPHAALLRFQHEAAQSRKARAERELGVAREWLASLRVEVSALTALLQV
ncbi:MAG TPA: hypothetical protein VIL85_08950 [Thermomicrobiales bacterium]|jgi:hypothetical protein